MTIQTLTKRQRELYDFLATFIREKGYGPSLEEIGDALELSSLATVHKHLTNLAERGYIKRSWNRSRSIVLLVADGCCPTCGRPLSSDVHEAKVSMDEGRKSDTMGSVVDASTSTTPTTTEVP